MAILDGTVTLSAYTLCNLIRRRGGEPHKVIGETAAFYDPDAERKLDQEVNATLTKAGLMGPRGMDRDLLALIDSISHPHLEFYGWFDGQFEDGSPSKFGALVGSGNGGGFGLVRVGGSPTLAVTRQRPELLLDTFLDIVPRAKAPVGEQLIVSRTEYETGRSVDSDEAPRGGIMQSAPSRTQQLSPLKEIQRIMKEPRTGAGALYVAARTRSGQRRRIPKPINFIDIAEGRWLMEERPGRESLVVYSPGSRQAIQERLRVAQSALG
ncbi:ESX secretion-associated protein EspG [Amycolatopsis benzoatilytica]|uniref:ESX secretion-associated protein EspG n=1 Tax=Amycolatopsis benzoatilytica TaxID=346045 RepID=UPI0003733D97|nr:ESX secretion-associated protein EspG [Amycolatopsis benzoatilytica]